MSMKLPLAPMTNEIPPAIRGEVMREKVTMPSVFKHPAMESIGLFSDDATIPLIKPSGKDLHPAIPMVSSVAPIHYPMPSVPRDLFKGVSAPATKMPFGMARIEQHGKKNVPVPLRG